MPRKNHSKKPAQPARYQIAQNCDNKRRFDTEREALAAKEHQELLNMGLRLTVYRCNVPGCSGWHLTRSK